MREDWSSQLEFPTRNLPSLALPLLSLEALYRRAAAFRAVGEESFPFSRERSLSLSLVLPGTSKLSAEFQFEFWFEFFRASVCTSSKSCVYILLYTQPNSSPLSSSLYVLDCSLCVRFPSIRFRIAECVCLLNSASSTTRIRFRAHRLADADSNRSPRSRLRRSHYRTQAASGRWLRIAESSRWFFCDHWIPLVFVSSFWYSFTVIYSVCVCV